MSFFIITGIVIILIIIYSILGKYRNFISLIAVLSFLTWSFSSSTVNEKKKQKKEENIVKKEKTEFKKNERKDSYYSHEEFLKYEKREKNRKNNSFIKKQRKNIIVGAICRDGTISNATGSGACSYHGGVAQWLIK